MPEQAPIRRDPNYRPNHDRSITISGVIDDALVSRLLPEIVKLQSVSRDPITVYIDSPDGDTEDAKTLLEALRSGDQDQSEPCRLITVALGKASSAASDILMSGDYALAYPYTKVLCHGTRHLISRPTALTKDVAANFAKNMAGLDEGFAIALARNCVDRFMFRISRIWQAMNDLAETGPGLFGDDDIPTAKGIAQEFCVFLRANGLTGERILEQLVAAGESAYAVITFVGRSDLFDARKAKDDPAGKDMAVRTAILADALANSSTESEFSGLEANYRVLCDFFEDHHRNMIERLRRRWSTDICGYRDYQRATAANHSNEDERIKQIESWVTARCFSLWFLFVFFCRQLQTGDFPMTATEAYWLGLIDEVIGLDLPSPRILVENAPDIPDTLQQGFEEGFHGTPQP